MEARLTAEERVINASCVGVAGSKTDEGVIVSRGAGLTGAAAHESVGTAVRVRDPLLSCLKL